MQGTSHLQRLPGSVASPPRSVASRPVDSGTFSALFRGSTRSCSLSYRSTVYHILRVGFLADVDVPFLTVAGDIHAEDSRHVAHIGNLEPVHQLLLELVEQSIHGAEKQNVVHV